MHQPFHEWLQQRITAAGLSGPAELSTRMTEVRDGAAVDRRTVWRWCAGKRLPTAPYWHALSVALGVPVHELALRVVGVEPLEGGEE